eukprot:6185198-Pleurochrysis_carterae.AAC.2
MAGLQSVRPARSARRSVHGHRRRCPLCQRKRRHARACTLYTARTLTLYSARTLTHTYAHTSASLRVLRFASYPRCVA